MNEVSLSKGVKLVFNFDEIENESDLEEALRQTLKVLDWKQKISNQTREISVENISKRGHKVGAKGSIQGPVLEALATLKTPSSLRQVYDVIKVNQPKISNSSVSSALYNLAVIKQTINRKKNEDLEYVFWLPEVKINETK